MSPQTEPIPPDVSIIALVGDHGPWLDESVLSVLSQPGCHLELILVDHGAPESVWNRCMEHAASDARVRCLRPTPVSEAERWRLGRDAAVGQYLQFLLLPDLLGPQSLLTLLAAALRESADAVVGRQLLYTAQETLGAEIAWKHVPLHEKPAASDVNTHPGLLGVRGSRGMLLHATAARSLDLHPGDGRLDVDGSVTVLLLANLRRIVAVDAVAWIRRTVPGSDWQGRMAELLASENASADQVLDLGSQALWRSFWRSSLDGHLRPLVADVIAKTRGAVLGPALRQQLLEYLLRRDRNEWSRLQPRLRAGFSLLAEGEPELVASAWRMWDVREGAASEAGLAKGARLVRRLARSRFADDLAVSRYYSELVIRPAAKQDLQDAQILALAKILRLGEHSPRVAVELNEPSDRELTLHQALTLNDPDLLNPPGELPAIVVCHSATRSGDQLELRTLLPSGVRLGPGAVVSSHGGSTPVQFDAETAAEEADGHWVIRCAVEALEPDVTYSITVPLSATKAQASAHVHLGDGAEHWIPTAAETLLVDAETPGSRLMLRRHRLTAAQRWWRRREELSASRTAR